MTATAPQRPTALPVNPDSLPVDQAFDAPQYVTWGWREKSGRPGEWTKPLFRPVDGRNASHSRREDWGSRRAALAAMRQRGHDGIGFVLTHDLGIVGLDFDKCRDPETGEMAPWAAEWVDRFASASEVTPSGTGVRIFVRGVLPAHIPEGGTKRDNREVYAGKRYLTLTGHRLPGTRPTVEARQDVLDAFIAAYFPAPPPKESASVPPRAVPLDDATLIERARSWDDGGEFDRLYRGDWSGFTDRSRADWHLAWRGAFLFGGDPTRVEAMMRSSFLSREKWDDRRNDGTLLAYTVAKACREQTQFYDPLRPHRGPNNPPEGAAAADAPEADDPLAVYLAMPHDELAQLAHELSGAVLARDEALADARRKARELERLPSALQAFDRNPEFPKAGKPVAKAVTFLYHQMKGQGKAEDDGFVPTSLPAIAEVCGGSKDSVGDQLSRIATLDVGIHKRVEDRPFRRVDDDGQVTIERRKVLLVKVDHETVDELQICAAYRKPAEDATSEKAGWGGTRKPCPHCQSTRRRKVVSCADCGHEFTNTVTEEADPIEGLRAEQRPDEPRADAPTVPPTPITPDAPHTYPHAATAPVHVVESAEGDGDEADTWDPYECNTTGCTRRTLPDKRYCDWHDPDRLARFSQRPQAPPAADPVFALVGDDRDVAPVLPPYQPPPAPQRPSVPLATQTGLGATCGVCSAPMYAREGKPLLCPRCLAEAREADLLGGDMAAGGGS